MNVLKAGIVKLILISIQKLQSRMFFKILENKRYSTQTSMLKKIMWNSYLNMYTYSKHLVFSCNSLFVNGFFYSKIIDFLIGTVGVTHTWPINVVKTIDSITLKGISASTSIDRILVRFIFRMFSITIPNEFNIYTIILITDI